MAHIFIRVEYAFHSLSFFHGIIIVGAEMKKRGGMLGRRMFHQERVKNGLGDTAVSCTG